MGIVVKKFGGTSVAGTERIRHVADVVSKYKIKNPEDSIIVVVSAMAGETNKLVALAKELSPKPAEREMDVLLSTGEQVTIALTSMALIDKNVDAQSLDAQQAKISTDNRHTNAQILDIDTQQILELIEKGKVPVIAGFQGVDKFGDITTLGRGGSDISAVAIAAAINAKACYIYTDVDGVFSTDPRICKDAKLLSKVCHEEMLEMASLGAKVLHPRSVYFAMRYNVPLVVLSTFNPKEGTWIVKEDELMEKPIVTGITYRNDEAKITVSGLHGGIRSLNKIFGTLAEENIFIDMITQTGLENDTTSISFTVPDENSSRALELTLKCIPEIKAEGAFLDRNISKVSVVGVGMRYHTGVASKMFSVLAAENIEVQMISTSEIKVSVLVLRKYCEIAVRALHEAFIDMTPDIRVEE